VSVVRIAIAVCLLRRLRLVVVVVAVIVYDASSSVTRPGLTNEILRRSFYTLGNTFVDGFFQTASATQHVLGHIHAGSERVQS